MTSKMMWSNSVFLILVVSLGVDSALPGTPKSKDACPDSCKCDGGAKGQMSMACRQGGLDVNKLGRILDQTPLNVYSIDISGVFAPNKLSFSMDFARFKQLKELSLRRDGIQGLGSGALTAIPRVRVLSLADNAIQFIDMRTFFGARRLQQLDLSRNQLGAGSLPTGTFGYLHSLRWLSLADNNITTLPHDLLGDAHQLNTLILDGNRLQPHQVSKVLYGAPELTDLSLSECKLSALPNDFFAPVPRLQRVNLANNELSTVPSLALLSARMLSSLNLDNNQISHLPYNAFYGLALQELSLARNHLGMCYGGNNQSTRTTTEYSQSGIDPAALTALNLSTLDLSYNQYRLFDSRLLGNSRLTIKLLDLSGNALSEIKPEQTADMQLTALHMSNTRMRTWPKDLPAALSSLRVLNVSRNQLATANYYILSSMPYLSSLDLSTNRLTTIDGDIVSLFGDMSQVLVYHNPFDCHCHITPLQHWLTKRNQPETTVLAQCLSPSHNYGQPVVNIERPTDCAVLFGASSGLTQKSELGILGGLFTGSVLLLALLLLTVYLARTWRRKGVYHTKELTSTAAAQNMLPSTHHSPNTNDTERLF